MNNTEHRSNPIRNEQTGTPLHKNEVVSINNELNFELLSARQQLTRILTAANVSSVDEVVERLEGRKVDKVLRVSPSREQIAMVDDDGITQIYIRQDVVTKTLRDPQGFLINTDFDDTMSKPLSDEEIEQAAEQSSEVQEATYTPQHKITYKHGYIDGYKAAANHQQAGWVDVKDVKDFLFMMSERHEDKLCFDIADIIKFTSQPLPPKPKQ